MQSHSFNCAVSSKTAKIIRSPSKDDLIDECVKKQLVELYKSMRTSDFENYKLLVSNAKPNPADSTLATTRLIPRIHSFSPDKKKLILPQRSLDLYQKLNNFYQSKYQDIQKKRKKSNYIYNQLCKLHEKYRNAAFKSYSNSPERDTGVKGPAPRVPSLLIKTQVF